MDPNDIIAAQHFEGELYIKASDYHRVVRAAVLAEREACAKVCEDGVQNATDWDSSYWDQACENRAAAIRARGRA